MLGPTGIGGRGGPPGGRGYSQTACAQAIKDCTAKGDATLNATFVCVLGEAKTLNAAERAQQELMTECSGPPGSGGAGGPPGGRGYSQTACAQAIKDCTAKADATLDATFVCMVGEDCMAKGGATSECVNGEAKTLNAAEKAQQELMTECSGPPGSGGAGGPPGGRGYSQTACAQAIKDCTAKGDATSECVNGEAKTLNAAEKAQQALMAACSDPPPNPGVGDLKGGAGYNQTACAQAMKDCTAKGDATSECVNGEAKTLNAAEKAQQALMAACSDPPPNPGVGDLKGGAGYNQSACAQAMKDCTAKGDATSECVNGEAKTLNAAEKAQQALMAACSDPPPNPGVGDLKGGAGYNQSACAQAMKDCTAKGDATSECVNGEAKTLNAAEKAQQALMAACSDPPPNPGVGDLKGGAGYNQSACAQAMKDCTAKGDATSECVNGEAKTLTTMCPDGNPRDAAGGCALIKQTTCGAGETTSSSGCQKSKEAGCFAGYTLTNGTCVRGSTLCPPGEVRGPNGCVSARTPPACPSNKVAGLNGTCVCPPATKPCAVGQMQGLDCGCVPAPTTTACGSGEELVNGQCQCLPGEVRDSDRGGCIPRLVTTPTTPAGTTPVTPLNPTCTVRGEVIENGHCQCPSGEAPRDGSCMAASPPAGSKTLTPQKILTLPPKKIVTPPPLPKIARPTTPTLKLPLGSQYKQER